MGKSRTRTEKGRRGELDPIVSCFDFVIYDPNRRNPPIVKRMAKKNESGQWSQYNMDRECMKSTRIYLFIPSLSTLQSLEPFAYQMIGVDFMHFAPIERCRWPGPKCSLSRSSIHRCRFRWRQPLSPIMIHVDSGERECFSRRDLFPGPVSPLSSPGATHMVIKAQIHSRRNTTCMSTRIR